MGTEAVGLFEDPLASAFPISEGDNRVNRAEMWAVQPPLVLSHRKKIGQLGKNHHVGAHGSNGKSFAHPPWGTGPNCTRRTSRMHLTRDLSCRW